MQFGWFP
jgi:hypothetical protein